MPDTLPVASPTSLFRQAVKLIAVAASTGAALVTLFKALYSFGVIGQPESHESIGNLGAAWVGLRPAADTASSINDTLHYVATVSDKNGSILVGARPVWTTGDSSIAIALSNGSVIARGPGTTTVNVVVGSLVAHSRIVVKQRVADVQVVGAVGDSLVTLREGAQQHLLGRAIDARGYVITGLRPEWRIDDSSVAVIDSNGAITGRNAGRTVVSANIAGISGRSRVAVSTTAAALKQVAGMGQSALAGRTLPQPIVVRATNRRGAPAAGQVVTFRLPNGQGVVDLPAALTDADGRARTLWTLGGYPGRQTLLVSVENVDSAIAVVAEAEPVASNTRVAVLAERLSGKAGQITSEVPAVRVTDTSGRALPDVVVRWSTTNGGSVEALAARTDSLGVARARWKLGRKTGTQRLRAQVGGQLSQGVQPVTILASAAAGAPTTIGIVSGDAQKAAAGAVLPKPVAFRVLDADGNGVANAAVVLSPSGGKVPEGTLHTDSLGVARTRWTLGHSAGPYSLAVHVDGIRKLLKVTARAVPAAAANLSFEDAPSKTATKSRAKRLSALVTDVYGNPVPDAKVTFSVKSGTVTPTRAVSDTRGRVALTWTPGLKPGEQRLSGVVSGTDVKGAYITQGLGDEPAAKVASAVKPATKPAAKSASRTPTTKTPTKAGTKVPAKPATKTPALSTRRPG
jgi:hypothetical protein